MTAPKANTIIHANSMEFLEAGHLDDAVDLVVTSPPYDDIRSYEGYEFEGARMAKALYRAVKEGGAVVWVVGDKIVDGNRTLTSLRQGLEFQEAGFKCHDLMIYEKLNTPFMRSNAYTQAHELMYVFVKGKLKTFNALTKIAATEKTTKCKAQANKKKDGTHKDVELVMEAGREIKRTNIWEYATGSSCTNTKEAFEHPAIFPEELAADHIHSWSNKGDLVLDPMCGSGTTCAVAKVMERDFIGIDISEKYCEIARRRTDNTIPLL